MNKKFKIKKGDKVIVTTGSSKGKTGFVSKMLVKSDSVIVEGVNLVTRHMKPTQFSEGGIVKKEAKIHISNIALLDSVTEKPIKVGYRIEERKKVRFNKKTGQIV